ncbi:hypothetical protein K070079E91_20880 [Eisenbergiella porci]
MYEQCKDTCKSDNFEHPDTREKSENVQYLHEKINVRKKVYKKYITKIKK